jgi:hypothetical protein
MMHLSTLVTITGLLACFGLPLEMSQSRAAPTDTPALSNITSVAGLDVWDGPSFRAGWADMDLDGRADPIFVAFDKLLYVTSNETGEFETHVASVLGGPKPPFADSMGDQTPIVSGDFDRDGRIDLMVFSGRPRVYTISAPGVLEYQEVVASRLASATFAVDAAAADLNLDGWPDVVVGVGRFSNEHMYPAGARDSIYMNRGGHFERMDLEPSKKAHTNSITLADVDADGRVDVVESLDFSETVGFSRVLFNKTPPGANIPVFEPEAIPFDYGSYGMGAAVADVDGDGHLDIYNASGGRDYLLLRQADGTYQDETMARGLIHEWGTNGARVQWSPTFADMNGDGLLDLFVRHGHITTTSFADFGLTAGAQMNLLYVQSVDGRFTRISIPFDPDREEGGVEAVMGDVNGDGLPDLAMGNLFFDVSEPPIQGSPELWLNVANPPENSRRLVVRLKPTVSANPPTGARVEATCGFITKTRSFTTGGKVGALVPTEVNLSWGDCPADEAISLSIVWPSGVVSQHATVGAEVYITPTEPSWFGVTAGPEGTRTLSVTTGLTGNEPVCFLPADDAESTCCPTEGPCEILLDSGLGRPGVLSIGNTLGVGLDPPEGELVLVSEPDVPVPGEEVLLLVGQGRTALDGVEPWLRVEGDKIPWGSFNEGAKVYQASVPVPALNASLAVKVFVENTTRLNANLPTGVMLDPRIDEDSLFPYQDPGFNKLWRVFTTPSAGVDSISKELLEVRLSTGEVLPSVKWTVGGFGRFILEIPWDVLPEGETVSVYEAGIERLGPLPVYHEGFFDDLGLRLQSVRGFLTRPAVVEGGDNTRIYVTLLDGDGYPMAPDPSLVTFETEGLERIGDVTVPNVMNWEVSAMFQATEGLNDGKIRVKNVSDGSLLGLFTVRKRPRLDLPIDVEASSVYIDYDSIPAGVDARAKVTVRVRNEWGELLGPDSELTYQGGDGLFMSPIYAEEFGTHAIDIEPGFYGGDYAVEVFASGQSIGSVTLEVVGPKAPGLSYEVGASDPLADITGGEDATGVEPTAPDESGCQGGFGSRRLLWLSLLLWFAFALRRVHASDSL